MKKTTPTIYVIFTEARSFPKNPAYEGPDVTIAAKTILDAADRGRSPAIRIRWRGKLSFGLVSDVDPLTVEIRRQRNLQPKEVSKL